MYRALLLEAWLNSTSSTCRNQLPGSLFCYRASFADVAETEGILISLHPDDPPWGLLGIAIIHHHYQRAIWPKGPKRLADIL